MIDCRLCANCKIKITLKHSNPWWKTRLVFHPTRIRCTKDMWNGRVYKNFNSFMRHPKRLFDHIETLGKLKVGLESTCPHYSPMGAGRPREDYNEDIAFGKKSN